MATLGEILNQKGLTFAREILDTGEKKVADSELLLSFWSNRLESESYIGESKYVHAKRDGFFRKLNIIVIAK